MAQDLVIKYMYHRLWTGQTLSIAFEMNKIKGQGGPVRVAFAFGSKKDVFSRPTARKLLHERLESGDFLIRTQVVGQHILDVVADAMNSEEFFKKMPPSWQGKFPKGIRMRKAMHITAPSKYDDHSEDMLSEFDFYVPANDWANQK